MAFAIANFDAHIKISEKGTSMIAVEQNELNAWAQMIFKKWGGSHQAIARAMEVPIELVNDMLGNATDNEHNSTGLIDLKKALLKDNDELVMFWSLYSEAWRNNESPATFAHTFSHLRFMLRRESTITFDACIELREMMDHGFAHIKSCLRCNRVMILIPSLVAQTPVCDCC
jgi:hypothetical protein